MPAELERIITKALEKERELRYQGALEIGADLKRFRRDTTSGRSVVPGSAAAAASQVRASGATPLAATGLRAIPRWLTFGGATVILATALLTAWWTTHRPEEARQLKQRRLTANPVDLPVESAAISPDGKYLGYSDEEGIHLQLVATGEMQNVPPPLGIKAGEAYWLSDSWYPDSTRFTAALAVPGRPFSLWSVPLLGGVPQRLIEDFHAGAGVSPDGSSIAFSRVPSALGRREIWLMGTHGESPHRILAGDESSGFSTIVWSPAGDRLAYIYTHEQGHKTVHSVESCDLKGTGRTTMLVDDKLLDFAWVSPGRLILSRSVEDNSDYHSADLWDLKVDSSTGVPEGKPRRRTDWSGFSVWGLTATADGKHLVFLRGTSHESAFVGDLAANTNGMVKARRLTAEDSSNIPLAWTQDSKQVILSSQRSEGRQIYKQAADGSAPPQLVTQAPAMDFYIARAAPDGVSLIVEGSLRGSDKFGLYRVDVGGGAPVLLFETKTFVSLSCSNRQGNLCVYGLSQPNEKELILSSFETNGGKSKELLQIPVEPGAQYNWAISPDGSQIAIAKEGWNTGEIRFFQVRGGGTRTIAVHGYVSLRSIDWAPDSKSMFIASSGPSGSVLLRVNVDGSARPVWQQSRSDEIWGIPSPDGRHLALSGFTEDANVWMIDNF